MNKLVTETLKELDWHLNINKELMKRHIAQWLAPYATVCLTR